MPLTGVVAPLFFTGWWLVMPRMALWPVGIITPVLSHGSWDQYVATFIFNFTYNTHISFSNIYLRIEVLGLISEEDLTKENWILFKMLMYDL
jgi:hypothetical protein